MAALNAIAKEYADEIRDGIAWVIVWKTGRSWHAEAFWLNCDDDAFEPDDLERAREILDQDPSAVMLNGYYCGHFGEGMTVNEIAAGIRWHYENGCNLLEGSTAFPPEPVERPAELPADMPWYEMQAAEAPDPYVYDGHMSPEDYEHMHELMDLARPAVEPPDLSGVPPDASPNHAESVTLELTIGPEGAEKLAETLKAAIERAAEATRKIMDAIVAAFKKAAAAAAKAMSDFVDSLLYKANDHPKWWHLYKHAKKYRVRKKYRRRLMQQLIDKLRASPDMEVIT